MGQDPARQVRHREREEQAVKVRINGCKSGSCPWRTYPRSDSPGSAWPPPGPAHGAPACGSYGCPLRGVVHPLIQHGQGLLNLVALGRQQRPAAALTRLSTNKAMARSS
jgi:hypothetical protein